MMNEIAVVIEARKKDIGIEVGRILPAAQKRMVGPFIFLDHMGPSLMHPPSDHMDVRPHPHIGLATLTYLFEGQILHRDSLGSKQIIVPGEVNWMTAGSGIAHSEREPQEVRKGERTIHGLQFWVAMPADFEDGAPAFEHYAEGDIPSFETNSLELSLVAGEAFGKRSPLKAHSPMIFLVMRGKLAGEMSLEASAFERGLYVVKGSVKINDVNYHAGQLIVFDPGSAIHFTHSQDALLALIGGTPFPEKRFIWWNFVSSSEAKIERAKRAWENRTFPQVPDDPEFIPLPAN